MADQKELLAGLNEELGHHGLAIDLDDLIRDESNHRDEIRMILARWDD